MTDTHCRRHGEVGTQTLPVLRIDLAARRVWVGDDRVLVTRTQFDILAVLHRHSGRVVSRMALMYETWGHTYFSNPDHLSVHIHHIRRALGDCNDDPHFIETVRGVGYMLLAPADGEHAQVTLHFDSDSILLAVSPHREFLGWKPSEIIGGYFSLADLAPAQSRSALELVRVMRELRGVVMAVCADGRMHPVEVLIELDDTYVPDGYRGTILDIDVSDT